MKKTFLKATLFSLMVSMVPAAITSCKDYDDDIKSLNTKDDQLQDEISDKLAQQEQALTNQIKALETALAEQKEAAATATAAAKAAADAAQAAADKAQQTADAGVKAAAEADAKAQAANMEAEAAKAAAAQAKADAIEEAKTMVEALRADVAKQMEELDAKYGKLYSELAEAVGKAATKEDLDAAVTSLEKSIAALEEKFKASEAEIKDALTEHLKQITQNANDINEINGTLKGIDERLGVVEDKATTNANKIVEITTKTIPALKSELEGKIKTVSDDLASHISEFNKLQKQVDVQKETLDNFQQTYNDFVAELETKLDKIDGAIKDHGDRIKAVEDDLAAAQKAIAENADEIDALDGRISTLKGTVEEQGQTISAIQEQLKKIEVSISNINKALSTLNAINAKRLTSVSLVPSAYYGGIPTIDFFTASFKPRRSYPDQNGEYPYNPSANTTFVPASDTEVLYRLNPSGVTLEDIKAKNVTFVQEIATSRATSTEPVVQVSGVKKNEDGTLAVTAVKTADKGSDMSSAGTSDAGFNKIYTVALRVPIAEKNYYTWTDSEGKTVTETADDAVVYSEYTRVAETFFTPGIASAYSYNSSTRHPLSSTEVAWSHEDQRPDYYFESRSVLGDKDFVYLTVPYNTVNFDLAKYVTGSKTFSNGKETVTTYLDNYAAYPFTFSYEFIPYESQAESTKGYADVKSDGKLTATNPAGTDVNSRIGKVVTIRVTMRYQNQVIEQKYFNVKYVLAEPINVYFNTNKYTHFTWDLYTKLNDAYSTCTWDDVKVGGNVVQEGFLTQFSKAVNAQNIYDKAFSITRAEFENIYSVSSITKAYANFGTTITEVQVTSQGINTTPSANNNWIIRYDGVATDFYDVDGINGKGVKILVTYTPNNTGYPEVTLELTGKVVWPKVPVFGTVDSPRVWTIEGANNQLNMLIDNFNETQKLAPMAYEVAIKNGETELSYKGNVLTARFWQPYILNKDAKAPIKWNWDIVVNQRGNNYDWYVNGINDESAATVWANQKSISDKYNLTLTDATNNDKFTDVNFTVNNNKAGRALVNQEQPIVDLIWNVYLNGTEARNLYTVGHTYMYILKPLTNVYFATIPAVVQNFAEQSVQVAEYMRATDQYYTEGAALNSEHGAFDATCGQNNAATKFEYYGFSNVTYAISKRSVPEAELSYYQQMGIAVDENTGELTFNTENTTLMRPLNVTIDVKGDYYYGSFTTQAVVTINPNSIAPANARKR